MVSVNVIVIILVALIRIRSDLSADNSGDALVVEGMPPEEKTLLLRSGRHHHGQGGKRSDLLDSSLKDYISHHTSSMHHHGDSSSARIENINLRQSIIVRSKHGMHDCEQGTCTFVDCPNPTNKWCTDADTFLGNSANAEFDICFKEDPSTMTTTGITGALYCSKTLQFGWSDAGLSSCINPESLAVDGLCCLDCYFKQYNKYPPRKGIHIIDEHP